MPCIFHTIEEQIPSAYRLDRYVSEILRLLSRSQIKVRNLKAKINGKDVKLSRIVKQGEKLELYWDDSPPVDIIPEEIQLDIIYEDDKCIVINKIQGMVVHPGAGNRQGTLANALYFRMKNNNTEKTANDVRPGIVHRLDKETSGVIITALDDETHAFLAEQFKSRKVEKTYIAIVCGMPKETKGKIDTRIARDPKNRKSFTVSASGKHAVTYFKVIKSWQTYSLLILRPSTGRTHQLRVHLRHIGCPILGDPVYGINDKYFPDSSLMLHSKTLVINLPGKTEAAVFSAPVPERFTGTINKLDRMYNHG
jgi:23S rRNA pseudouridine1911/1915/1917 synthase